jgi:hypothetical protein
MRGKLPLSTFGDRELDKRLSYVSRSISLAVVTSCVLLVI